MTTILETIADYARMRVSKAKAEISLSKMMEMALSCEFNGNFEFEKALRKNDIAFICECKKASPSKGIISESFDCVSIAKEYEMAGADCISILTEPKWFLGSNNYLENASRSVNVPIIRKDFTVDEYMIYEAKVLGAKAVLLICSILDSKVIEKYIHICDKIGISALVEAHNEDEIKSALCAGARIIGVNNRNLEDFSIDTQNSFRMRGMVPKDIIFVSESGVKNHDDIVRLREIGADAVLIGEALMTSGDKNSKLNELRGII